MSYEGPARLRSTCDLTCMLAEVGVGMEVRAHESITLMKKSIINSGRTEWERIDLLIAL